MEADEAWSMKPNEKIIAKSKMSQLRGKCRYLQEKAVATDLGEKFNTEGWRVLSRKIIICLGN